jgi:hypothetical protein
MKIFLVIIIGFTAGCVFGQETILGVSWGMSVKEIKGIYPKMYIEGDRDTLTGKIDNLDFAGYDASAWLGFHPQYGLLLIWIIFSESIDEISMMKALETKYVRIDTNFWDWHLYANSNRSTYVVLKTPIGDINVLEYYKGEIYEGLMSLRKSGRASDL